MWYVNNCFRNCYQCISDSDSHDSEPTEHLLKLYSYKLQQLREITNQVYNADDLKRLSLKLAREQRAILSVSSLRFT